MTTRKPMPAFGGSHRPAPGFGTTPPKAQLIIFTNVKDNPVIVNLKSNMTIGREVHDSHPDIPINSKIVSRKHGSFSVSSGGFFYEDSDSFNGTFVNGTLYKHDRNPCTSPIQLKDGDILRIDCADSKTGLYPLTEDLMEIYKEVGTYKGWYTEEGWLGFTKDDAWMFACYYFIGEVYEDDVEEWPETDTAKLETLSKKIFTENGRDIIELTANTEDKSVYSFTAWESGIYTVILEGDSTLEAWAVNSEGEIIASTEGATTSIASIDIEADADETVYIVTRTLHTAETSVVIIINYFSGIDGDVNSDGELTAKDSALLKKYLAGAVDPDKVSEKGMDIDGNGDINAQDSVKLKKALRS